VPVGGVGRPDTHEVAREFARAECGGRTSMMSSVIAIAKTPSLNASTRLVGISPIVGAADERPAGRCFAGARDGRGHGFLPVSTQCLNVAIQSLAHAPSQGMAPCCNCVRMASACRVTSS
jgi:hypothetical protein